MNILFVNTFDVSPFLGGTERITDTLCREFRKRCLCRCYLAYYEGIDSLYKKTVFDGRLCLGSRKNVALLIDYIVKKDIVRNTMRVPMPRGRQWAQSRRDTFPYAVLI